MTREQLDELREVLRHQHMPNHATVLDLLDTIDAKDAEIARLRTLLGVRESEIDNLHARLDIYCTSVPLKTVGTATVRLNDA